MIRACLFLLFCLLVCLSACDTTEPIDGCVLSAAKKRVVLRGQHYLSPQIPARILGVKLASGTTPAFAHAALVFHLDRGWFAYDLFGTRPLHIDQEGAPDILPAVAARAAFPGWAVLDARWLD